MAAGAIVLATGARERPRAARRIPGDRPDGIYTTGQLQNLVHLQHEAVGRRAVVIGAELVSWSAVMTLRHGGCRTVGMTTTQPRSEAYAAFRALGRLVLKVPVMPRTRVVGIAGRQRVESVTVENLDTGHRTTVPCDVVVTTGDWIPDHELGRFAHERARPVRHRQPGAPGGHRGRGRARRPGERGRAPALGDPQLVAPGAALPCRDLLLWTDEFRRLPVVLARQDGRTVNRRRLLWPAVPGRIYRVPAEVLDGASPAGGPVVLHLE